MTRLDTFGILAASFVLTSCQTGAPHHTFQWWSYDGDEPMYYPTSSPPGGGDPRDDQIYVTGEDCVLVGEELSLVTWPELTPVPAAVVVDSSPPRPFGPALDAPGAVAVGYDTIAVLTPAVALEARWYAVRWQGESRLQIEVAGVPLSDGTVVWRFHAHHAPVGGEPVPPVPGALCAGVACE